MANGMLHVKKTMASHDVVFRARCETERGFDRPRPWIAILGSAEFDDVDQFDDAALPRAPTDRCLPKDDSRGSSPASVY